MILESFFIGIGAGVGSGIGSYFATKYANHRIEEAVANLRRIQKELVVAWKKIP